MPPTPTRVPWSELTALAAGCLAVATLRVAGRAPTPEDAAVALVAMAVAWGPRYALESSSPAFADAAGFAGAFGSVAATAAGRVPPTGYAGDFVAVLPFDLRAGARPSP